jgi:hypothetical protein
MTIKYQEHDIDDVFRYFVGGFKCPIGKIENWEANYDPLKGKVIFRLFVNDKKHEEKNHE